MTILNEETVRHLRNALDSILFDEEGFTEAIFNKKELNEIADAVEMQISKKPLRNGIPQCPNCKSDTIADYAAGHLYNYCGDCGQAIDWSKEE